MSQEEQWKNVAVYLKKLQKQQAKFTKQPSLQNIAAEASFIVAYNHVRKCKPFLMASLLNSAWNWWIVQAYCALKQKKIHHFTIKKGYGAVHTLKQ